MIRYARGTLVSRRIIVKLFPTNEDTRGSGDRAMAMEWYHTHIRYCSPVGVYITLGLPLGRPGT